MTIAVRHGGKTATLALSTRAAGALEALIARANASDEDWEGECNLDGELETTEGYPK